MTASSDDFQALVHLVDRTVGSLGRLQAIVDETLGKLETLQSQLRAIEEERRSEWPDVPAGTASHEGDVAPDLRR